MDSAPEADVPEYEKIAKAQEDRIKAKYYKHTDNVLQTTTSKPVTPDILKNNALANKLLKTKPNATASSTPNISKPGTESVEKISWKKLDKLQSVRTGIFHHV